MAALEEPTRDLGFGSVVARQSRRRLLNRDGSFNVERRGLDPLASLSLYHHLITVSWSRFLCLLGAAYLAVNLLFAAGYTACGPDALDGVRATGTGGRFLEAFFFSVQTFATIGYGRMSPNGLLANLLMTLESVAGLLLFALGTGIVFARFSRPTAKILFSERAVVSPYRGMTSFQFRIVNARSSQIIELNAKVMMSRFGPGGNREFHILPLERDSVAFFPLSWTIVHPIDERSPLFGVAEEELAASEVEFLVLLAGVDETFAQTVHARSSYKASEIAWGAAFVNIFNPPAQDGTLTIDIARLGEVEPRSEK